jgi:hypothetical protein
MHGHAFIPPMPVPRESPPGPIKLVRLLRRNLLDLFLERTYRSQVIAVRLLGRRAIVVNSPELVREVFVL